MKPQRQSVNVQRLDAGGLDESVRGAVRALTQFAQESEAGGLDESIHDALEALTQLLDQGEASRQTGVAGAGEGPSSDTTRAESGQEGVQKGYAQLAALETRDGGHTVADQPSGGHTFTIQSVTGETVEV